jgi:hypothetical protein
MTEENQAHSPGHCLWTVQGSKIMMVEDRGFVGLFNIGLREILTSPLWGLNGSAFFPRAMPWADALRPFGAWLYASKW